MKKFELKWKLYNYIKYPESWSPLWIITNLITCLIEVCTNILDHLSGSLLQD